MILPEACPYQGQAFLCLPEHVAQPTQKRKEEQTGLIVALAVEFDVVESS